MIGWAGGVGQAQPLAVAGVGRGVRGGRGGRRDWGGRHPAHVRGALVHAAHGVPPVPAAAARAVQAGAAVPRLPLQRAPQVPAAGAQGLQRRDTGCTRRVPGQQHGQRGVGGPAAARRRVRRRRRARPRPRPRRGTDAELVHCDDIIVVNSKCLIPQVQLRRNLPPEDEEEPQRDTLPASRPSSSSSSPSANIPLQRIVQSVKHTKKREGQWLQQGWLVHCTNRDRTLRRHYWRLDSKAITLFQSEHGTKYYKEIPLNEILAVDTARPSPAVRARHQVLQGDPAQRDPRRGHRAALARR
ncbi:hypothetical protein ACJJTC_000091 [Scirpophaga incertulas]